MCVLSTNNTECRSNTINNKTNRMISNHLVPILLEIHFQFSFRGKAYQV